MGFKSREVKAKKARLKFLKSEVKEGRISRREFKQLRSQEGLVLAGQKRPSVAAQVLGKAPIKTQSQIYQEQTQQTRQASIEKGFVSIDQQPKTPIKQAETFVKQRQIRHHFPSTIPIKQDVDITPRPQPSIVEMKQRPGASFGLGGGGEVRAFKDEPSKFEIQRRKGQKEFQTGVKQQSQLLKAKGEIRQQAADFGASFVETTPGAFVVGAATLIGTKNLALARAAQVAFAVGTPLYVTHKARQIGLKEETIGGALGEASGLVVGFEGARLTPKAIRLQASVLTGTTIGGKSAKARSGRLSKAQIRKRSFGIQRGKTFYDKGEIGIRLKGKKTYPGVKEEVLRFQPKKVNVFTSETPKGEKITRPIKLVEQKIRTKKGETFKIRYDKGKGFIDITKGGFQQPTQKRKLFPKGFGSQSVSIVKSPMGKNLIGETLVVQRPRSFKPFEVVKPVKAPRPQTIKRFVGKDVATELLEVPKGKESFGRITARTIQKGGFRQGYGEDLITRVKGKVLERQRIKAFSEVSEIQLPKITTRPSLKVTTRPTQIFKSRLLFDTSAFEREKVRQTPLITPTFDIGIKQGQRFSQALSFDYPKDIVTKPTFKKPKVPKKPRTPNFFDIPYTPTPTPLKIPLGGGFGFKTRKTPTPPQRIVPPPVIFPGFKKGKKQKEDDYFRLFKQQKFYTPSATAQIFNIKVPKSKIGKISKRLVTGFELRPGV